MKISVLINTYNRRELLGKTVEALLAQDYPLGEIELLVLDDAGSDGTFEALSARSSELLSRGLRGFRALRNSRNLGVAHGRGLLAGAASPDSEALLYLDDDVYLEKDTIGGLAGCLLENPSCALAGPRLVYASSPERTAHCANFVGKWSGRYYERDAASEVECDWLNSSCFLARRAALTGVSHANNFYITHEEVDFCLQLKNAGHSIIYFPAVKAAHDLPLASGARRDRLYYLYRNKLFVLRRNFPALRFFTASALIVLLGLPRYLLESVSSNRGLNLSEIKLIFRALADGLSGRDGKL